MATAETTTQSTSDNWNIVRQRLLEEYRTPTQTPEKKFAREINEELKRYEAATSKDGKPGKQHRYVSKIHRVAQSSVDVDKILNQENTVKEAKKEKTTEPIVTKEEMQALLPTPADGNSASTTSDTDKKAALVTPPPVVSEPAVVPPTEIKTEPVSPLEARVAALEEELRSLRGERDRLRERNELLEKGAVATPVSGRGRGRFLRGLATGVLATVAAGTLIFGAWWTNNRLQESQLTPTPARPTAFPTNRGLSSQEITATAQVMQTATRAAQAAFNATGTAVSRATESARAALTPTPNPTEQAASALRAVELRLDNEGITSSSARQAIEALTVKGAGIDNQTLNDITFMYKDAVRVSQVGLTDKEIMDAVGIRNTVQDALLPKDATQLDREKFLNGIVKSILTTRPSLSDAGTNITPFRLETCEKFFETLSKHSDFKWTIVAKGVTSSPNNIKCLEAREISAVPGLQENILTMARGMQGIGSYRVNITDGPTSGLNVNKHELVLEIRDENTKVTIWVMVKCGNVTFKEVPAKKVPTVTPTLVPTPTIVRPGEYLVCIAPNQYVTVSEESLKGLLRSRGENPEDMDITQMQIRLTELSCGFPATPTGPFPTIPRGTEIPLTNVCIGVDQNGQRIYARKFTTQIVQELLAVPGGYDKDINSITTAQLIADYENAACKGLLTQTPTATAARTNTPPPPPTQQPEQPGVPVVPQEVPTSPASTPIPTQSPPFPTPTPAPAQSTGTPSRVPTATVSVETPISSPPAATPTPTVVPVFATPTSAPPEPTRAVPTATAAVETPVSVSVVASTTPTSVPAPTFSPTPTVVPVFATPTSAPPEPTRAVPTATAAVETPGPSATAVLATPTSVSGSGAVPTATTAMSFATPTPAG